MKKNWWDIPPATNKQQTKLDTIAKHIYSLSLSSKNSILKSYWTTITLYSRFVIGKSGSESGSLLLYV